MNMVRLNSHSNLPLVGRSKAMKSASGGGSARPSRLDSYIGKQYPHPNLAKATFDLPTRGRWVEAATVPRSPPPPCGEVEGDANRLRVGVTEIGTALIVSWLIRILSFVVLLLFMLFQLQINAHAKIVEHRVDPVVFRLQKTPAGDVYLDATLHKYQLWTSRSTGRFFISCDRGRIDGFRLNIVLNTALIRFIDSSEKIFLGVWTWKKTKSLLLNSKVTIAQDVPPKELNFDRFVVGYSELVRRYTPFRAEEDQSVYISTFPDASFFQALTSGDRLSLVAYDKKSQRYAVIFHAVYELGKAVKVKFIKSCVEQ